MKNLTQLIGISCLAVILVSCAKVRKVTYPPNFVYIEKTGVKSTMSVFAENVLLIDKELMTKKERKNIDREKIVAAMDAILSAANALDQGMEQTNHRVIDHNLEVFRGSVKQARLMVQKQPPNYYQAGQLSGQCMACHKLRRY